MNLSEYLKNAKYFSLGHLPTEGFHPQTRNLSDLVHHDLDTAIQLIQKIDTEALQKLKPVIPLIEKMRRDIQLTLSRGNRVFLSGCGATGRLALALESTWRTVHRGSKDENAIQALMAGGDFALVKSVENFEDYPEFGIRHLTDLGFTQGDLLIAITEGGETPYVIGTVLGALALSGTQDPWFVFCNPTQVLCDTVERSREIIQTPRVKSLCIPVGEMALSGSTRLQAATVQMFAVGLALFKNPNDDEQTLEAFLSEYRQLDLAGFLKPAIRWESNCYQKQESVIYQTEHYPIAVLTDTTERSPTFSLVPFEKRSETQPPFSLSYLSIPSAKTALDSWISILGRSPIGLEWPELNGRLSLSSLLEFNFGQSAVQERQARLAPRIQREISINPDEYRENVVIESSDFKTQLGTSLLNDPLYEQILIKLILNNLSLMVMGLLDRYEGNVMTWVRASNGKLIDRTIRYLEFLIQKRGLAPVSRDQLAEMIFENQNRLEADQPMIFKILTLLQNKTS